MKLSGLILTIGAAALALLACAPPPTSTLGIAGACPDGTSIASRVFDLAPPFDADSYGNCSAKGAGCDVPPTSGTASAYADKITAAFNIAPAPLQTELCDLDRIYVVTDPNLQRKNPMAWGMRQRLKNLKKHIGISSAVWISPPPAAPFVGYENWVLARLLQYPWPQGPSYVAANPDTEALMTLAILAHEIGHVLWWDKNLVTRQCPVNGTLQSFYDFSWQTVSPAHGFHRFGEDSGTHLIENFTKDDIVRLVKRGTASSLKDAAQKMQTIYGNGNWASLFAFVAPDEDFVETYKLWVLTNATNQSNLQSLKISLPGPTPVTVDVLTNFNNPNSTLGMKKAWIDALFNGQQCT